MSLTLKQVKNLDAFILDLRTTTVKQGRGKLRLADDSFCCLGRACEISGLGTWGDKIQTQVIEPLWGDKIEAKFYVFSLESETSDGLPFEIMNNLGFSDRFGIHLREISDVWIRNSLGNFECENLADLNDSGEFTFKMIADIVEYWKNNQEVIG